MSGISEIAKEAGLKSELVANLFEAITALVARGHKVKINGFGSFERRIYPGRTLTTPAVNNGEPIEYPDSYVMKFKQSQTAKRRINIVARRQASHALVAAATPPGKAKVRPKKSTAPVPDAKPKKKRKPTAEE